MRQSVAGQFPRWRGLPGERFPSGGTVNAMDRLGDDMAVRLPLVAGGAGDVTAEREWLPRLAPLLPTTIPEAGALTAPEPLAGDLARFVAAMRDVTLPGAPVARRGGPLATLDAGTRAALDAWRALPEEGVGCEALAAVWEDALRAPDRDGPPVWLHAPGVESASGHRP